LGIKVEPKHVRLNTTSDHEYAWKILLEKEEELLGIFSKNISNHSVGALRKLCAGVGVTFEAVLLSKHKDHPDIITSVRIISHTASLANKEIVLKRYELLYKDL
jgi:hypothetical protein